MSQIPENVGSQMQEIMGEFGGNLERMLAVNLVFMMAQGKTTELHTRAGRLQLEMLGELRSEVQALQQELKELKTSVLFLGGSNGNQH